MRIRFLLWTICRGCPWLWYCISPIGRHHTSGLSLLLSAIRFFFSSAAQGCSGNWKPRPATSPNVESGMPSGVVVGAGGAPARPRPPPPTRFQTPEKSILPSGVLGAGPSRTGLPSGVRGTPGVGYDGHCAPTAGDSATTRVITPAILEPQPLTPTS